MKIVLIGGHLSPALALLDILSKDDEVTFIGRKYALEGDNRQSLEYQTITKRGLPFIHLTTGRVQRHLSRHSVKMPYKISVGFFQSLKALKKIRPDVVVGFGGYLSVPVCLAAKALGIPVVIHEQTLEVGLANKIIAKFASKICISWEQSIKFFPRDKVVLTGNPLKQFTASHFKFNNAEKELPLIYITGGSTGAHAINVLIEGCLKELLVKYRVLHQTGDSFEFNDYDRLARYRLTLPKEMQERYQIEKFILPEMVGSILSQADLVVSRSGINTVTEILFFGVPSLFIPLPFGQKGEQLKNAQFVKKIGLGEIVLQKEATSENLQRMIKAMIENKKEYTAHTQEAKNQIVSDGARNILEVLSYVVKKKTS